jgi:hypothetical protein
VNTTLTHSVLDNETGGLYAVARNEASRLLDLFGLRIDAIHAMKARADSALEAKRKLRTEAEKLIDQLSPEQYRRLREQARADIVGRLPWLATHEGKTGFEGMLRSRMVERLRDFRAAKTNENRRLALHQPFGTAGVRREIVRVFVR